VLDQTCQYVPVVEPGERSIDHSLPLLPIVQVIFAGVGQLNPLFNFGYEVKVLTPLIVYAVLSVINCVQDYQVVLFFPPIKRVGDLMSNASIRVQFIEDEPSILKINI